MCDQWLLAEYDDGSHGVYGSFRYLQDKWQDIKVAEKHMTNGCKKEYVANCGGGALIVTTSCRDEEGRIKEEKEEEVRCFGPWYFGCSSNRRIDVGEGEKLVIFQNRLTRRELKSGHISFWTADPSKGIELEMPPGNNNWKTEAGCYCCKKDYGLLENPFSFSGRRAAWDVEGGTAQCMLAWRVIGNGMNHEHPSDSSVAGVLLMIPEFVVNVADVMTGTIARHVACAATCPMRSAKFEKNAYSFTKIQTEQDKY